MKYLLPILFLSLLSCSSIEVHQSCLPLVTYSKETQTRFASELSSLNNKPTIEQFLGDYKALRDADRICLTR